MSILLRISLRISLCYFIVGFIALFHCGIVLRALTVYYPDASSAFQCVNILSHLLN